jgi:HEAT repeat protein
MAVEKCFIQTGLPLALNNENRILKNKAAVALGRIGRDAKDAITALKEVLQDENKVVQKNAEWALSEIE